jgi:hypothetical protein
VELWCDPGRKLRTDPAGRDMLISCGPVLLRLRLGPEPGEHNQGRCPSAGVHRRYGSPDGVLPHAIST